MSARNSAGEYVHRKYSRHYRLTLNTVRPVQLGTTIAATGSNWSVGLDAGIYVDGSLLQIHP